jgi:tetratricopeptide (TPR) repeat protein
MIPRRSATSKCAPSHRVCDEFLQWVGADSAKPAEAKAHGCSCAIISSTYPFPGGSCPTREIDLPTAVSEIKQACDETSAGESPFFIIAGAGISAPSVPLASQIESECRATAAKYGRVDEPPPKSTPIDTYSHWFQRAFPQAKQRQNYFRKLIENKPITHANLRLAHLLGDKRLATLAVTPNFDDFISRALSLFGQRHIVCDHPSTVERIDPESGDVQILHVHGTYWFYDGCNLRGEIEQRTQDLPNQPLTMSLLLGNILSRHSPLVIGYAGWEDDVIMASLKRRLNGRLGNNLYWFCFRRSDADSLPLWLRQHRDVCLVLPPEPSATAADSKTAPDPKSAISPDDRTRTLTAYKVLDTFIEAFGLQAPALTRDPVGFFSDQLQKSLPFEEPGEDKYELKAVIRRVDTIREASQVLPEIEAQLELVRDAVRRSAYREALGIAGGLAQRLVTQEQRESLMKSVMSAAAGLDDNSQTELEGYDLILQLAGEDLAGGTEARELVARALFNKGQVLEQLQRHEEVVEIYDRLLQLFGGATEPALRARVDKALVYKGFALGELKRSEEAIQTYDQVLQRFGDASEPVLRGLVANALVNKGARLGELKRSEEAAQVYDEVVQRFGDASEPVLREGVARALVNKGFALGELKRSEEAIQTYDQAVQRVGDASEPVLREQAAMALVNKGVTLVELKRREEAIQTYDQLVQRFGNASEPALREGVARALVNKGALLGELERSEEAAQACDEVVQRFGNASEPALREWVAMALVYKGFALGELERGEEAVQAYDQVVRRFGDATEPALREQVAAALVHKGLRLTELKRSEEAIQSYDQVVHRFCDASEPVLREGVARALVNKGFALGELKRSEEAIQTCDQVVQRFGDATELALRERVAQALANKGHQLAAMKRSEEAIQVYDQVVQRFGDASEPALRVQVAIALVSKGTALRGLSRNDDAGTVFKEVLSRFEGATEEPLKAQVDRAKAELQSLAGPSLPKPPDAASPAT